MDGGSEKTFITRRLQQTLKFPVSTHHTQITGLGGTIVGNSSSQCSFIIKSKNSNLILNMNAIVVSKFTSFLPSRYVKNECIPQFEELQLTDPKFYKPAPIDIIIGSDFLPYINLKSVRSIMEHGLEARESQLGWYLSGPLLNIQILAFTTCAADSQDVLL